MITVQLGLLVESTWNVYAYDMETVQGDQGNSKARVGSSDTTADKTVRFDKRYLLSGT